MSGSCCYAAKQICIHTHNVVHQTYIMLEYQLKSYFQISIKSKGFVSNKLGSKPKQPQITFLQEWKTQPKASLVLLHCLMISGRQLYSITSQLRLPLLVFNHFRQPRIRRPEVTSGQLSRVRKKSEQPYYWLEKGRKTVETSYSHKESVGGDLEQ